MISNVGIDLFAVRDFNRVGLLANLEGLNVRLCTTSTAFSRSMFPTVPVTVSTADEGGIYILTLSTEEMEEVFEMNQTYGEITFTECTVLYMAAKYCQAIITAEPRMRRTAGNLGIVVYDYEWFLEQMADSGVISMTTARDKLHELKTKVNPALFRDSNAGISFRLQTAEGVRI
jgi:hypothetical protein